MKPILDSYYRERLLENLITTAPFLRAVEEARRRHLVEQFIPMRVAADTSIIEQGKNAGGFYLIVLGGVEITKKVGESTVIPVATLREGRLFWESSACSAAMSRAPR